jgi:hypothetical protein
MQRAAEIVRLCFYLLLSAAVVYVAIAAGVTLERMNREMDRNAILHQQMLLDHLKELKDHERIMQQGR